MRQNAARVFGDGYQITRTLSNTAQGGQVFLVRVTHSYPRKIIFSKQLVVLKTFPSKLAMASAKNEVMAAKALRQYSNGLESSQRIVNFIHKHTIHVLGTCTDPPVSLFTEACLSGVSQCRL